MPRKPVVRSIVWMMTLILVSSCLFAAGCHQEESIKIGFLGATSGRGADMGIDGRDAVQMAIEQWNAKGGINGHRIELLIKDDQQDPEIARKAVQDLHKAGAVAIIGPMTSEMAMEVTPILNRLQIPAVSPTASTRLLSGHDDYFFRIAQTTRQNAAKYAAYHIKKTDIRRLVVALDWSNRSFTENWLKYFRKHYAAHDGTIEATIRFHNQQQRSFTEIAHELLAWKADGILLLANSMDSAMLCQQIRKLDPDIPITIADWGSTERLLEVGGKAVEGVIVVQTFDRTSSGERYLAFKKAYFTRFKREPGYPGVYAYDAAQVVLAALENRQDGQDLTDIIPATQRYQGLQGEFSIDEFGDVKRYNTSISVIHDRKFIVLE